LKAVPRDHHAAELYERAVGYLSAEGDRGQAENEEREDAHELL
jgi:hypothetical protein